MLETPSDVKSLALRPLGAGDLIDRTIRFYRNNFWTFVSIGAPPVVLGTVLLVAWSFLAGELFVVDASRPEEAQFYQVFIGFGSIVIWFVQLVAVLAVMGGASRNFVRHLLFNEAITFRQTYRNTRKRFFGLIFVAASIGIVLFIAWVFVFYAWFLAIALSVVAGGFIGIAVPVIGFLIGGLLAVAFTLGALWLFFAAVSRFVYVPQVMLVEGLGAVAAIGRSFSLAGKNVTRVGSLFVFTTISTYVVLMLLILPLWFYGWTEGIDFIQFDAADTVPAWYEVLSQVIGQTSLILMLPVLLIGLCLLYIDERVRSEGYDLELMAVKRLGEIPDVPERFVNPLQPALSKTPSTTTKQQDTSSTLGIND